MLCMEGIYFINIILLSAPVLPEFCRFLNHLQSGVAEGMVGVQRFINHSSTIFFSSSTQGRQCAAGGQHSLLHRT